VYGGLSTIQYYYERAYSAVRELLSANQYTILIEEAFSPFNWENFMNNSDNVVLDIHIYQCFDDYSRGLTYGQHLNKTCFDDVDLVKKQTLPTIVGEWSVAFKMESALAFQIFKKNNS